MGLCCCAQNPPYEKPVESTQQSHDHDMLRTTSASPTSSNTNQPMLEQKKFTNGRQIEKKISEMALCDENTSTLCDTSLKLIEALSIYHSFVHNHPQTTTNDNICDMIYNQVTKYNLMQLRADSHHILTYHEDNRKFMKALFTKLMDLNDENGISNVQAITSKIDEDEQKRYYFGHTGDEEINMIQTLNQIHHDITYAYAHGSDEEEDNGSMTSIHSMNEAGDSVNEMEDDSDSDSMNIINDSNQNMTDDDVDDTEDSDDTDGEMDDDMDDMDEETPVNIKDKIKSKTNKNQKRGYTKSKTNDEDMDDDMDDMDAYTKDDKKKRKVGRLKLKKKAEKAKDDYLYTGKQKINDDASWMNKKHKKKSKHVVSESIQMLRNTKLVSNNSLKEISLGALEENEFDLTKFNADGIEMDDDEDDEM